MLAASPSLVFLFAFLRFCSDLFCSDIIAFIRFRVFSCVLSYSNLSLFPLSLLLSSTPAIPPFPSCCPDTVAYDLIREHGYPDFMENPTKPSYPSKKPVGKLYHHVRSRACELSLSNTRSIGDEIEADSRYLTEGRFGYMESAVLTYESYCRDVSMIMLRFELKSGERSEQGIMIQYKNEWRKL
jgi:hypothetical protein